MKENFELVDEKSKLKPHKRLKQILFPAFVITIKRHEMLKTV